VHASGTKASALGKILRAYIYGVRAGGVPIERRFSATYFMIVFIWKNDYLVLYGAPSKQCRLTLPRNDLRRAIL
jgi:ABC-type bacteriocin/lantibiotic exporter with double-glycine peptidase domain